MPSLNQRERVEVIMRHIYNHPHDKHTYQSLARDTSIPSSSIRATVTVDYPDIFGRSDTSGIILAEPITFPNNREFDLRPQDEKPIDQHELEPPPTNREQQLLDIISGLTAKLQEQPSKQTTPRQRPPKDGWIATYPTEDNFNEGQAMVNTIPQLMTMMSNVSRNPNSDKVYYKPWNLAMHILITLKAMRAVDPEKGITFNDALDRMIQPS